MFGYKVKEQMVEKLPGSMLVAVFIFDSGRSFFLRLRGSMKAFGKYVSSGKLTALQTPTCFVLHTPFSHLLLTGAAGFEARYSASRGSFFQTGLSEPGNLVSGKAGTEKACIRLSVRRIL